MNRAAPTFSKILKLNIGEWKRGIHSSFSLFISRQLPSLLVVYTKLKGDFINRKGFRNRLRCLFTARLPWSQWLTEIVNDDFGFLPPTKTPNERMVKPLQKLRWFGGKMSPGNSWIVKCQYLRVGSTKDSQNWYFYFLGKFANKQEING